MILIVIEVGIIEENENHCVLYRYTEQVCQKSNRVYIVLLSFRTNLQPVRCGTFVLDRQR